MQEGLYISGAAHLALILWALFGGLFLRGDDPLPVETMDVSVLTAEEFAMLTVPLEPDLPQPEEIATPEPTAPPEPEPETAPPAAAPEAELAPEPAPQPQPMALPPVAEVPDAPVSDDPPTPPAADRVAPDIAPTPPVAAERAPEVSPAIADEPTPEAEVVEEEKPQTAPEEAAPEIVTEAERPSTAAPLRSMMPTARPSQLAAARRPEPTPQETAPPKPEQSDAIADAVAAAVATPDAPRAAPSGPPLSVGEKDALRVSVQNCWNVGSLSTEALRTTVTVYVSMQQDGRPDVGSIRLVGFEGGTDAGAQNAFEAARRAIIRCGSSGFDLPREKYSHWQEIEMIFNPNGMRMK